MLTISLFSLLLFYSSLVFFKPKKNDVFFIFFLSIYHYLFSYFFILFTKDQNNDSSNYFIWSMDRSFEELSYMSTDLVIVIVKLISKSGALYNEIFYIFSFISGLAIIGIFSYISKKYNYFGNSILNIYTLSLLPGLHFWTVAIGKDALCIFAFYLLCTSKFKMNSLKLILGLIILLLVRYHILVLLIIAFGLHVYTTSRVKPWHLSKGIVRVLTLAIAIPVSVFMYQYILSTIQKYSINGFDGITDFIENRSDVYADVGSGVALANQPYLIKVFALVFGGIPWVSLDLLSLAAMLEGGVILYLIYYIIRFYILNKDIFQLQSEKINILLWFIFFFILMMPLISGNLGLMVRMRIMLYFPLILIFAHSKNIFLKKYIKEM